MAPRKEAANPSERYTSLPFAAVPIQAIVTPSRLQRHERVETISPPHQPYHGLAAMVLNVAKLSGTMVIRVDTLIPGLVSAVGRPMM